MIWMEFRCENRTNSDRPQAQFGPRCWSDTNAGPMDGTAVDTQADVVATYRDLCDEATKAGWKRRADGWTCPDCVRSLGTALADEQVGIPASCRDEPKDPHQPTTPGEQEGAENV